MQNSGQQTVSFLKGLVLFYLIFLVVFFAATPFLAFWLYWETDLSTSMLPELIGFCLQGGFLVLVFALFERRSVINAKRNQKLILRSYLGSLLQRAMAPDRNPVHGMLPALEAFAAEREALAAGTLDPSIRTRLREALEREAVSLESLGAVAAQIDHEHLTAWSGLVECARDIRRAPDAEATDRAITALLDHIADFDQSPIL
ncbi:MAG: hypothetical protein HQL82_01185 [Magnetococcales bacterium]|nr:hypothetical protein [Magnetococcales bacterium]